jgi:exonuclease III
MRFRKKDYRERKEHYSYDNGTWKVRTLNREGKLENLKREMQKNEMSVLVVSEVRWKGQGKIKSGDCKMYYSGGERTENDVAIVVHKSVVGGVVKKIAYNDRIIAIKLQAEPIYFFIMQVYMPTSEYEDDEAEKCDIIEEILEEDGKCDTNTIITGDWSSVVGGESYRNIFGPHGLGRKNHKSQIFINFRESFGLIVINT